MMQERIGETAGKVWRALGQQGEVSLTTLPKVVNEKEDMVFQALGWLAHEGKLVYSKKSNRNYVSLTAPEREAFRTIH
jgi:hypothetical protein